MKKVLLFGILILSFMSFSQYEEEIKTLNNACDTPFFDIDCVFVGYERSYYDVIYLFSDDFNERYYVIEYEGAQAIVSYVERYDRKNLRKMKRAIKTASDEYYYVVSAIKEDDNILITSTKK